MSHFTTIKTQFRSRPSLLAALTELGLNPEVAAFGNQLKMETNWTDREHFADFVVRKSALDIGADVGFKWAADDGCYKVIADEYELRKSRCKIPNFRQKLSEEYAVQVAVSSGRYQVVSRTTTTDGRMQVRLQPKQLAVRR